MRLTRRQLNIIIESYLNEEENSETDSSDQSFVKMESIINKNFEDAKNSFIRKLYSNDLTNKLREKVKSILSKKASMAYSEKGLNDILELIVPKEREQRYRDVTDQNDPYYLNNIPQIIKTTKEKFDDIKLSMDTNNQEWREFFRKSKNQGLDVKGAFFNGEVSVNTDSFSKHLGKNEYAQKLRAALSLIANDDVDGWGSFDNAVRETIFHELSHAFDDEFSTGGKDLITNLANRALERYKIVYPGTITADNQNEIPLLNYSDNQDEGSQDIRNYLKPVIKEKYHGCITGEPDSDESSLSPKEEGMPLEYNVSRCQYLNIYNKSGQTEVLTRIRQIKTSVEGINIGVGKFKAEHIQYLKDNNPDADDVILLMRMLRDDVSNQEIADAFNAVVPAG